MINLTYEIVCDLCSKECGTQQYSYHWFPLAEIPKPRLDFSYCMQKFRLELCNDCAAPLVKTLDTAIRARCEQEQPR